MESAQAKVKEVPSLISEGKRIVAMCTYNNSIFIATEHEVFKYEPSDGTWTQLKFKVIE